MTRKELESLGRDALVREAASAGVSRPEALTSTELVDAVLAAGARHRTSERPRGWLGRARDLLTSVIDRGLALPDARRGEPRIGTTVPAPLPTVTLAEIYAAQGHLERAVGTLDEVLAREPEHAEAKRLRERFVEQQRRVRPSMPPAAVEARLETIPPPPPAPAVEGSAAEAPAAPTSIPEEPTAAEVSIAPLVEHDRYEIDEVVAVAVDPHTVYLYWEVRPQSLAAARAEAPDGSLVVRVACVTPDPDAPRVEVRDLRVDALHGELFVRGVPAGTEVRVTVGYRQGETYRPFAVGVEIATPRAQPARAVARRFGRWNEGGSPLEASAPAGFDASGEPTGWSASGSTAPHHGGEQPSHAGTAGGEERGMSTGSEGGHAPGALERLPGSSELFRRPGAWSRTVRWPGDRAG